MVSRPRYLVPPPRRSRVLAVAALVCLALGVSVAVPTVHELWLSNVAAARAQDRLGAELPLDEHPGLATPATAPVPADVPFEGSPLGRLRIERIGVDTAVVVGTEPDDLALGPGWMTSSAFPGQPGNSVVSGHRTTYGAPFRRLDELVTGDRVIVTLPNQAPSVYEVRDHQVVSPGDVWVAAPTSGVRLTLTTCHPAGSDAYRYVVQAELVDGPGRDLTVPAGAWAPSRPV